MDEDKGIIRKNPGGWVWLVFVFAIFMFIAVVIFYYLTTDLGHTPEWAPDGCTVHTMTRRGQWVIINVHDIENFDTEPELASVILTTISEMRDFLQENNPVWDEKRVEIQFPPDSMERTYALTYREVHNGERLIRDLAVQVGRPELPAYAGPRFWVVGITAEMLQKVARGEQTLGFLQELDLDERYDVGEE